MKAVLGKDDDPRWVNAEEITSETSQAEIDAAWGLVDEPPTTIAGAAALVAYALANKLSDISWPPDRPKYGVGDDFSAALWRSRNNALSTRGTA
jgi:hypothetical protein